jgi:hypothetical protein
MVTPAPKPGASKAYWASIQDENGVDLTLIRSALRLTPEQRMERADAARRQALYIRTHARRIETPAPPDR